MADENGIEEWRSVKGTDGLYDVSSLGRVRSLRAEPQRVLRGLTGRQRYLRVRLCAPGRSRREFIHRLVLEAFLGECPDGMQASHLDGDPSNNAASNLVWESPLENCRRKAGHGTSLRGSRISNSRLTEAMVSRALAQLAAGQTQRSVAHSLGVCRTTIALIDRGEAWSHVERPHLQRFGR